jgi:hypothetical protein
MTSKGLSGAQCWGGGGTTGRLQACLLCLQWVASALCRIGRVCPVFLLQGFSCNIRRPTFQAQTCARHLFRCLPFPPLFFKCIANRF